MSSIVKVKGCLTAPVMLSDATEPAQDQPLKQSEKNKTSHLNFFFILDSP
jgi:hypothetical protein